MNDDDNDDGSQHASDFMQGCLTATIAGGLFWLAVYLAWKFL